MLKLTLSLFDNKNALFFFLKQCNRLTVATTKKLLVYNGWSFKGCPRCNRKLKRQWSHTHVQAVRIGMREKCLGDQLNQIANVCYMFKISIRFM